MSYESLQSYNFPTVLLVNLEDKSSRDFLASMTSEEWSKVSDLVDVSKVGRIQKYLDEYAYPMPFSSYPAAWVLIPKSHTFKKYDDIVCLSGFTSFKQIVDESQWQFVECLIEEYQMSPEHKRQYVMEKLLLDESIPAQVLGQLASCKTVKELTLLFYRLMKDYSNQEIIEDVKEVTKINLKSMRLSQEDRIEACLARIDG